MRHEGAKHENFFIAKHRDSESAQSAFSYPAWTSKTSSKRASLKCSITKSAALQAHLAKLSDAASAFSRLICTAARTRFRTADEHVSRGRASACQHFLKRDAVFFNVLVYSGCSAFRFPSARSD